MSPCNVLNSQQSAHAVQAGRAAAGAWKLATGRALSLHPRQRSVLEITQGRVWLTVVPASRWLHHTSGAAVQDQVLHAGERMVLPPGVHAVMEVWNPLHALDEATGAAFRWDRAPAPVRASAPVACATRDWECGVVQPLRDLARALGQGGRAVGTAAINAADAAARFAAGLARFALHRIAAPIPRTPA
jgi:hypothetical protein